MAESSKTEQEKKLRYLEFVHVLAIQTVLCMLNLYKYAKEKSGPLTSFINSLENTVNLVIRPVYDKFHRLPFKLLLFFDRKVCELVAELKGCIPARAKNAYTTAHKAVKAVRSLADDVQQSVLIGSAFKIAEEAFVRNESKFEEVYEQYGALAKQHAVSVWLSLNCLPLFTRVAEILVPTAAYCAECNNAVQSAVSRGNNVAQYLPLIPIEKIAKMFNGEREEPTTTTSASE